MSAMTNTSLGFLRTQESIRTQYSRCFQSWIPCRARDDGFELFAMTTGYVRDQHITVIPANAGIHTRSIFALLSVMDPVSSLNSSGQRNTVAS